MESTKPPDTNCPEGYHYRREHRVNAGCVTNKKQSTLVDPRCPEGMHWRNGHIFKGKCVKKSKARLKVQQGQTSAPSALPACGPEVVQKYWANHLKLILATVQHLNKNTLSNKTANKIQRRFVKTLQKKLNSHHCQYRPTEEEQVELYNMIFNTASNVQDINPGKPGSETGLDSEAALATSSDLLEPRAVTHPLLAQNLSDLDASDVTSLQELYHLYYLFHLFDTLPGASLNSKGRELLERYNYLFNQLALYRRKQNQAALSEAQLRKYIRNYGESQLDPVSLQELEVRYKGPFWSQSLVTVHCPHCNHLVQVTHYKPNGMVRCPYCQGVIKLT